MRQSFDCILTVAHHVKSGAEFSTCVVSALRNVWILEHFRFWIFGFRILNLLQRNIEERSFFSYLKGVVY